MFKQLQRVWYLQKKRKYFENLFLLLEEEEAITMTGSMKKFYDEWGIELYDLRNIR